VDLAFPVIQVIRSDDNAKAFWYLEIIHEIDQLRVYIRASPRIRWLRVHNIWESYSWAQTEQLRKGKFILVFGLFFLPSDGEVDPIGAEAEAAGEDAELVG
jgi:hypothetical protein